MMYLITCGTYCPGKFFEVSEFGFVCMCSCSIMKVNLLERGLESHVLSYYLSTYPALFLEFCLDSSRVLCAYSMAAVPKLVQCRCLLCI